MPLRPSLALLPCSLIPALARVNVLAEVLRYPGSSQIADATVVVAVTSPSALSTCQRG